MKLYLFIFVFIVLNNGISSIRAARLKCPPVEIANGSSKIRSRGRIIAYKCFRGFYLLGEPLAACIKGKWDSNPPICLRPGCVPIKTLLNGNIHESWRSSLLKFTCNPGYKLMGPSFIYCNGRKWNALQPFCKAVDINCDFENKTTCNWEIDDYDDEDFNWRLQQYETPSRSLKTGPLHDHTLSPNKSGYYIVLETSDYTSSSRPARIHSPVFPKPSDSSSCFIFWYHMYGNTIGNLNVFLNNNLVFQRQRNHGDRWIKGVISLNNKNISSSNELQFIIEGSYGGGYTGDIGLDDFSIANGTDCIAATVTSCVGRCYEDHEDTSFCLCNPECLTHSSCCGDFEDVCRLESTTTLIEGSTESEDSTQVYSDSDETTMTEYDTNSPEMPSSSTSEYETFVSQYSTDSITPMTMEDSYFLIETHQKTKESKFSTINNGFTPLKDTSNIEEVTTNARIQFIVNASTESSLATTNQPKRDKITNKINESITSEDYSTVSISYIQTKGEIATNVTKEMGIKNQKFYPLRLGTIPKHNLDATEKVMFSAYKSTSKPISTLSAKKQILPRIKNNYHTFTEETSNWKAGSVLNSTITTIAYPTETAIGTSTATKITSFPNFKTGKIPTSYLNKTTDRLAPVTTPFKIFLTRNNSITNNGLTSTLGPTQIYEKLRNITFKYVTGTSFMKSTTPYIHKYNISSVVTKTKNFTVDSMTEATLRTSSKAISLKNKTHFFRNFSSTTPKLINTLSVKRNKINDSHTHLQTTSLLYSNVHSTTKYTTLINSLKTSTKNIEQVTVIPPKKWKTKYRPKDRFVFSAIQSDKHKENHLVTSLLICSAVLVTTGVLLAIFFIRRRRFNFVNEVEEADTDILYHSSQEMLDFHIARPNH